MSDLRRLIERDYQDYVAMKPMDPELRRLLAAHERVPTFLRNLEVQFRHPKMQALMRKKSPPEQRMAIKICVHDMTDMFINHVVRKADERMMSEVAKAEIKAQEQRKKEIQEATDLAEAKAEIDGGPIVLEPPS